MRIALVDRVFLPRFRLAITDFLASWPEEDEIRLFATSFSHLPARIRIRFERERFEDDESLRARLDDHLPDLILSMYGLVATARLAYSYRGALPVVWLLQGMRDIDSGIDAPCRSARVQQLRRHLAGIVASNRLQRRTLEEAGFDPRILHVVPPGVGPEVLTLSRARREDGDQAQRLVWVGRPIPRKGLDFFREAVRLLIERLPELRITIVGVGRPAAAWPTSNRIRFRGFLEHEEMLAELAAGDLLAVSSSSRADGSREAIPQVVLEAMTIGVPVIALDSGAIPEAVVHGETGWLSRTAQPSRFAYEIEAFLADIALREHCARQARWSIERSFLRARSVERLRAILFEIHSQFQRGLDAP
jgi:glycosyltransferase involved in cell wall biosynthesis